MDVSQTSSSSPINNVGSAEAENIQPAGPLPAGEAPQNAMSAYEGAPVSAPQESGFDIFGILGSFLGLPLGGGGKNSNQFDLFSILGSIFDFGNQKNAEQQQTQQQQPTNALDANGNPLPAQTQPQDDKAPNEERSGVEEKAEIQGRYESDLLTAEGNAKAEAHATAKSHSEQFTDGKNVGVRAAAEASAGASVEANGKVTTPLGSVDGHAKVGAEVYARTSAEAQVGLDGASAGAHAATGAMARGEASSNMEMANGLVTGHAEAQAEAGAGAKADANVGVTFKPPAAAVKAKGEAFAGARAGYAAKGGVGGVGYGIAAEVWAGAGVKAEIDGGLDKDGKLKLEFCLGVAVGVGAQVKFGIEIDTKKIAQTFMQTLSSPGGLLGGIFDAVAGLFGGGKGNGEHAGKAIDSAMKGLGLDGNKALNQAKPPNTQATSQSEETPESDEVEQDDNTAEETESAETTAGNDGLIPAGSMA